MNISLDKELKDYADSVVKSGRFSTHSEYIRDMVRRDRVVATFDALILEGLHAKSLPPARLKSFLRKIRTKTL